MANYNPQLTTNLGVGEQQIVGDSTLTGAFTTQALAVGRDGAQPAMVAIFNSTDISATIQAASVDADANYVAVTTVAAGSALYFTTIGYFLRGSFAAAPASGTLIIAR